MALSTWMMGLAGTVASLAVLTNLPTRLWMAMAPATPAYLSKAQLMTTDGIKKSFMVRNYIHFLMYQYSRFNF
jgi:hypothetical protein